ncbi:hypothetical protein [Flavobacterium selenitireducens]|uniref:hypothetical protein n=1 Tax=Flavobacterium selenitireducens TaxID=2722704 RepID=UPI00168BEF37|nr:hypothetical protein [Flavobacterium selenitireducens]MBD3580874.1 hypothetical protein [Flavobacterium selenitireducens]
MDICPDFGIGFCSFGVPAASSQAHQVEEAVGPPSGCPLYLLPNRKGSASFSSLFRVKTFEVRQKDAASIPQATRPDAPQEVGGHFSTKNPFVCHARSR